MIRVIVARDATSLEHRRAHESTLRDRDAARGVVVRQGVGSRTAAVIDRIHAAGGRIDREATPIDVLNGRIVGLGRDPDGYVIGLSKRR
jgi:hypothetical protein